MRREFEYVPLTVAAVRDETADARSIVLDVPAELAGDFRYDAGQYCTFRTTLDGEEVVRCYSMSSSPVSGEPLTVTVKRVPGGAMSTWMNEGLAPGDTLETMPPTGRFVLRPSSTAPIVAFAGGSGITPVVSIVETALATTGREILLVYANRDRESVIFAERLERLEKGSGGRLTVHHHLDAEQGFLDAAACAGLVAGRVDADFYVCGPGPYMDVVEAGLAQLGVDAGRISVERFELDAEAAAAPVESVTESVTVRLGNKKVKVAYEAGETLLETARRGGLRPPFSCQHGSCGQCMALVEKGEVKMRVNNALDASEVEEGWVLTCQGVPTSREVVVDYDQ